MSKFRRKEMKTFFQKSGAYADLDYDEITKLWKTCEEIQETCAQIDDQKEMEKDFGSIDSKTFSKLK